MIRVYIAFAILFGLFFFGINAFRATTGKQKWEIVKTLMYSLVCAILSLLILIGIVVIF